MGILHARCSHAPETPAQKGKRGREEQAARASEQSLTQALLQRAAELDGLGGLQSEDQHGNSQQRRPLRAVPQTESVYENSHIVLPRICMNYQNIFCRLRIRNNPLGVEGQK